MILSLIIMEDEKTPILRKRLCNCKYPFLRILGVLVWTLPILVVAAIIGIVCVKVFLTSSEKPRWCTPSSEYYTSSWEKVDDLFSGEKIGILLFDCNGENGVGVYIYHPNSLVPPPGIQQQFKRGMWTEKWGEYPVYLSAGMTEIHPLYDKIFYSLLLGIFGAIIVIIISRCLVYMTLGITNESWPQKCKGMWCPCLV